MSFKSITTGAIQNKEQTRFKARGFNIQDIFSSSDSVLEIATFQQDTDKKSVSAYLRVVQKCIEVLPYNHTVKHTYNPASPATA